MKSGNQKANQLQTMAYSMKRLILLSSSILFSFAAIAQSSDAALTTQANVIRNETAPGGNTKTRIADMYQGIIDSKVSLLGSYANPNWITSLSASKIILPFYDNVALLKNNADNTKQARFDLSGLLTGSTSVVSWPSISGTMALTSDLPSYVSASSGLQRNGNNIELGSSSPSTSVLSGETRYIKSLYTSPGIALGELSLIDTKLSLSPIFSTPFSVNYAGLNIGQSSASITPTTLIDGDVWLLTVGNGGLFYRNSGTTYNVANTSGSQVFTNKTISGASNTLTNISPTASISGWPANSAGVLTNNGSGVLSWGAGGGGGSFITLSDAPSSYTSQAKKGVRVNGTPNGLEFYTITPNRTITSASAIVQTDENGTVVFNSATPFNFTIDQLTQGTIVNLLNKGSATVTLVAGSGVTITGATTLVGGSNYSAVVFYDTQTNPIITTSQINVNLTTDVSGVLPVANGGTGLSSPFASLAEAQAGTDNTKFMTPLRVADVTERRYNVKSYGAKGDGQVIFTNITATQNTITAGSSVFVAGDVGKLIKIAGGGASNAPITTTITGYTSGTQITIGTTITTSQTNAQIVWGTDDTAAIQSAFNAAWDANSGVVWVPIGLYLINGPLQTSVFGTNPNSQLYFKTSANTSNNKPQVKVIGEGSSSYAIRLTKGNATFFSLLTTGISGTAPAVIGSGATVAPPINFNYSDITIENLGILCFTNIYDTNYTANNPAYLSGINFLNVAKWSLRNVMIAAYEENSAQPSASPLGTNNFGFAGGRDFDNGTNYFIDCGVWGFEHGAVLGDHTICDGSMIFNTVNGIVPINLTHQVNGTNVTVHATKNAVYFPTTSFLGVSLGSGLRNVDLKLAYEFNSGTWNNATYIVDDQGVVGAGQITYSLFGNTIAASELLYNTPSNFPKFTLKYIGTTLPKVVSTGGSTGYNDLKAFTAIGYIAGQSIIESGSGNAQLGRVVVSNVQPSTTGYIGSFDAINGSGSANRNWSLYVKNDGAINTGATEEYLMNAGSFTQVSYTKNSDRAFIQPLVVGSLSGVTASTMLDIRGVSSGTALRVASSANAERFSILDNGAIGLSGANYGTSGQVLTSQGSGSAPVWSTPASLIRSIISIQTIATDANITASPGVSYFAAANLFTANRTIDVSALNTDNDYMEIYLGTQTSNLSFTGASVYLSDNTTTVSNVPVQVHINIRRKNGRLYIIN